MSRDILIRAQAYVARKYVARADERQRAMGLAYIEAEKDDLAREFARFAVDEINRDRAAHSSTTRAPASHHEGCTMSKSEIVKVAEFALAYIDAIPKEVIAVLPAMPGFDRDWADEVIARASAPSSTLRGPIENIEGSQS